MALGWTQDQARTKQRVPVMSSGAAARGRKLICAAYSLGDAPKKYTYAVHVQLRPSHETINKRR